MLQRGLAVAAGFLAAPRIAAMVPIEFPGGKLGEYVKEFLVITVGSQVVNKALGRKYGNALFAGGVIHIAVDMLQSYLTPFGAGAGAGVGLYLPPNDQLGLTYNGACLPGADVFAIGQVDRLSSRFS